MQTADQLIDAARQKCTPPTWYRLAKELGVVQSAVNHWRTGRMPDDQVALKLARILELDSGYVLAVVHAQRAKEAEVKDAWEKIASALALVLLGIGLAAAPSPAPAGESASSVYYVKLRRWQDLQRRLFGTSLRLL